MICIYHNRDLDGFCSAAIVKRKYPDAVMIGYDYGLELPMDKIPAGEPIIMVDVSVPMEQMFYLALNSGFKMRWVDHHASAINEFDEFCKKHHSGIPFLTNVLKVGIAACELTWRHLFPDESMPETVLLLGMYDTWRKEDNDKWEKQILPFQFGMRQICNSVETFPMNLLEADSINSEQNKLIINAGGLILGYVAQNAELACKRGAFEVVIDGLRAICLCGIGYGSDIFKSVWDESKHDIMVPFFFDGKKWIFSLFTTKPDIDCSVIAKARGGGGHKAAAGFETTNSNSVFPSMNLFEPIYSGPVTMKGGHQFPYPKNLQEGNIKGNQKPDSNSGVQAAPPEKS